MAYNCPSQDKKRRTDAAEVVLQEKRLIGRGSEKTVMYGFCCRLLSTGTFGGVGKTAVRPMDHVEASRNFRRSGSQAG